MELDTLHLHAKISYVAPKTLYQTFILIVCSTFIHMYDHVYVFLVFD